TVAQSGDMSACEYSVAPVSFTPCMHVPLELTAIVTAPASCPWSAASNMSWIRVTRGSSGSGTAVIGFTLADNYDAPRSGQILVRWPTPAAGQNLQVAQAGCRYGVSKTSIDFAAAGGAGSFNVLQQSDPTECGGPLQNACVWMAAADVSWIAITSSMPQIGDGTVVFNVSANIGSVPRSGTITVRDKTVTVTQIGAFAVR